MLPVPTRPRPPSRSTGISACALLARRGNPSQLSADDLERWLIEQQLAVPDGAPGLLVPTERALELAGALTLLG